MTTSSHQLLSRLLEAIPASMLVLDGQLQVLTSSAMYRQYFSPPQGIQHGHTMLLELPGWDHPDHQPFINALTTMNPLNAETWFTLPDGRGITVYAYHIQVEPDEAPDVLLQFGASSHLIGLSSARVFQQARMLFYVFDMQTGRFLVRSPLPEDITTQPPGPHWPSPDRLLAAIHEDDRPLVREALVALRAGNPASMEYRSWEDGVMRYWNVHAAPYMTEVEGMRYLAVTMQDVTWERKAEASRLRHTEERMRREREQAVLRAKANFLTLVSHEFRTPLAVVQSSAELLRKYRDRMEPAKLEKHFDRIEMQVDRLTSMLNEILLIGRIGTEHFENNARRIFIEQFIRDIVRSVQIATGSQHKITIQTHGVATPLIVDHDYMEHALAHIVRNAVVYSPPEATIEVHLYATPEAVRLEVRDNGPGITPDDLPHIFEFFYRGANALDVTGNGLGLGLARQVINLHRGSIAVESTSGEGTTVTVVLLVDNGLPNRLDQYTGDRN